MTDLAKGIIELDGIQIDKDTTKSNVLTLFSDNIAPMSGANLLYIDKKLYVDNTAFICTFYFSNEGSLIHVELFPCIEYTSEKWDRTGRQEERRQFCDAWLYERLGEPHKDLSGDIEYTFSNVSISCFSNFDIHNGADAGYIVVEYLR